MGPRVSGGGWLTIGGQAVDWIYRDLDEVDACWRRASRGEVVIHPQAGHPGGFPNWAYAGELALPVPLADPGGVGRSIVALGGSVDAAAVLVAEVAAAVGAVVRATE